MEEVLKFAVVLEVLYVIWIYIDWFYTVLVGWEKNALLTLPLSYKNVISESVLYIFIG